MTSEIKIGDPAPALWEKMLRQYPILTIDGVVYYPHSHGTPGINFPVWQWADWIFPYDKNPNYWPYAGSDGQSAYQKMGGLFAIGSPVLLQSGQKRNPENPHMSFILMDFDCPKSDQNLERIASTLQACFKGTPYYVLDSGNSYHAVVDALIPPKNIPWHFGRIVREFAKTEPAETREVFDGVGLYLQKFYKDRDGIRDICATLLEKITHYDSQDGLHFIFDLRWLAHQLLEFVDWSESHEGSFGQLRVSRREKKESPPILVLMGNSP